MATVGSLAIYTIVTEVKDIDKGEKIVYIETNCFSIREGLVHPRRSMRIVLVIQQEPSYDAVPQSRDRAAVGAREVKAYNICLELPVGSSTQFIDHLDAFLVHEMPSCRRDGRVIFTAYAVSWDPVQRIKAWAEAWMTQKSLV